MRSVRLMHHESCISCICTAVKSQDVSNIYSCSSITCFCVWLVQYADPVADLLDQWGVFRARLFRESCVFHRGNYVKDLSRLGRDLNNVIIVDNSPASYIFHPENAVSSSTTNTRVRSYCYCAARVCVCWVTLHVFFPAATAEAKTLKPLCLSRQLSTMLLIELVDHF